MDFLVTGFLYWIWRTLFGADEDESNSVNDMENGAAYFFSVDPPLENKSNENSTPVNNDYDDGPNW